MASHCLSLLPVVSPCTHTAGSPLPSGLCSGVLAPARHSLTTQLKWKGSASLHTQSLHFPILVHWFPLYFPPQHCP